MKLPGKLSFWDMFGIFGCVFFVELCGCRDVNGATSEMFVCC